jgi:hypothetical protein
MRPTKWLVQDGRTFEIRHQWIGRWCQTWVFDGEHALGVHSTVSLYEADARLSQSRDLIAEAIEQAIRDLATGHFNTIHREVVAAKLE